jgi:polyhydroxybutyrate depolymerase
MADNTPENTSAQPPVPIDADSSTVVKLRLLQADFQGRIRSYWLYVPAKLSSGPVPMLMVLHGTGSSGQQMLHMGDFIQHATNNQYIVVAPNALGRAFNDGSGRINGVSSDSTVADKADIDTRLTEVDDVAFLVELQKRISVEYPIDPAKNHLAGFSSGGAMTQRVALQEGQAFSSYVSVGGHLWTEGEDSVPARPLLLIFGDSDPLNPIEGGAVDYGQGLVLNKPSQLSTARGWSKRFDCNTQVQASQDIVRQIGWYQCDGGGPVLYQKIAGLGHYWAGGKISRYPNLSAEQVGPYLGLFITTEVIWDYFEHLLPASTKSRPQLNIIRP